MRCWIEACLQRCSVAYKCVPSRFACYLSYSYSHPRILSISFSAFCLSVHANHSFGLGFYVWCYSENRQTDTLQPNEKGTAAAKKNLAIRSLLCGRFHLEYKNVWHSSFNAFSLANGHRREKNRLLWFSIEKEWIEIRFFSTLAECACIREEMSNWRGVGDRLGLMAKENRFHFTFHISSSFFIHDPKQLLNFKC